MSTKTHDIEYLTNGWEKHFDPAEQNDYYYHPETKFTTWDAPSVTTHKRVSLVVGDNLPPGWSKHQDSESGQMYYVNGTEADGADNRRSTWNKPAMVGRSDDDDRKRKPADHQFNSFEIANPLSAANGKVKRNSIFERIKQGMHSNTYNNLEEANGGSTKSGSKKGRDLLLSSWQFRTFLLFCCLLLLGGVGLGVFLVTRQHRSNAASDGVNDRGPLLPLPTPDSTQRLVLSQDLTFEGFSCLSILADETSKERISKEFATCLEIKPVSRITAQTIEDEENKAQEKMSTCTIRFAATVDPSAGEGDGTDVQLRMDSLLKLCGDSLLKLLAAETNTNPESIRITDATNPVGTVEEKEKKSTTTTTTTTTALPITTTTAPPAFHWKSCVGNIPSTPLNQLATYPQDLVVGPQTLPTSSTNTILSLKRITPNCEVSEVGRSYGGFKWDNVSSAYATYSDYEVDSISCGADVSSRCTLNPPQSRAGQYRIDAYASKRVPKTNHLASRFLLQSTFGPTRTSVHDRMIFNDEKEWIEHETTIPPTFLREYFRKRTSPRENSRVGALYDACDVGARWIKYAFTAMDRGSTLKIYTGRTPNKFTWEINGVVRTETDTFNNEDFSSSSATTYNNTEFIVCSVSEAPFPRVDPTKGVVFLADQSSGSQYKECVTKFYSKMKHNNPDVQFTTPDRSITYLYDTNDITLQLVAGRTRAYVLTSFNAGGTGNDGTGTNCQSQKNTNSIVAKHGNIFLRKGAADYYRLDPRLKLLQNTLTVPANVKSAATSGSQECPSVNPNFINSASCVKRVSGCSPLLFTATPMRLNETTMRRWYTNSQRYVYTVANLRLEDPFNLSPCDGDRYGRSRFRKVVNGPCAGEYVESTNLNAATKATLIAVLEASTDQSNNFLRDVYVKKANLGTCDDTNAIGATIEIDGTTVGAKECWKHVHEDELTVYDAAYMTEAGHPGNREAFKAGRPNPIGKFAIEGKVEIAFPGWHAMSRWNDRRNQFKKIGRYGDIVSFNTLDVLLQTKSMADFVGAEQIQADGTFEACGSRGETANDVGLGHLYEFETIQADSQRSFEAMDQYTNPRDQKSGLWFNVAFGANDQLRQRIAWSLSTIIVVAEDGVGEDRNSEIWGNFFDIFVKHAFGNYHDIVREASYSPMMGKYLTYRQNKAYAFSGKFPDENYAREIMQLFTIGLWKLNNDGTRMTDPNDPTQYIPTYDIEDIVQFSRVWTGFDYQPRRSNGQARSGNNWIDPMRIIPAWRDQFPKTNVFGGYLGDRYPLCNSNTMSTFLNKGRKYILSGKNSVFGALDDRWPHTVVKGRFSPNPTTSSLYAALCQRDPGTNKCTWPREVVLEKNLKCDGVECDVARVIAVQMIDGAEIRYFTLAPPICVTLTWFNGVRAGTYQSSPKWGCTNPKTAVASPICCIANTTQMMDVSKYETSVAKEEGGTCHFRNEGMTLESAKNRCKQKGGVQCSNPIFPDGTWISTREKKTCNFKMNHWTEKTCNVQVQVQHSGTVNVVDDEEGFKSNVPEYQKNTENIFRVRWSGSWPTVKQDGTSCTSDFCVPSFGPSCICNTTTIDEPAFTGVSMIPSIKSEILNKIFVGSFEPSFYRNSNGSNQTNMYAKCTDATCTAVTGETGGTTTGLVAIWYRIDSNMTMNMDTIFEIESDIAGNTNHFLFNRHSVVSVGNGMEFRNPPKFNPMFGERTFNPKDNRNSNQMTSLMVPMAMYEVDALIKDLVEHPTTAPFVAQRLIQSMVTSNPTPRYVDVVATAFRTGIYNGITYSGKYGDMKATTMAVLLDREARTWILDEEPSFGKIRDPLQKLMHIMRSLDYQKKNNKELVFQDLNTRIGMNPFQSPSVFSYYLPEYQPPGRILENGLVAPEAQLNTAPYLVTLLNGLTSLVDYGLTSCFNGFGQYSSKSGIGGSYQCSRNGATDNSGLDVYNTQDGELTYSSQYSIDVALRELDMLLTSGRTSEDTFEAMKRNYEIKLKDLQHPNYFRGKVTKPNVEECMACSIDDDCLPGLVCFNPSGYGAVPGCTGKPSWNNRYCIRTDSTPLASTQPSDIRKKIALQTVLKLFFLSSEFHTNTFSSHNGIIRSPPKEVLSLGRPYKAVIVIFMNGGADSYNFLVPHSECNGKDLYQEYKDIRGEAALDKTDDLLLIDNDLQQTKPQPCAKFGIHHTLTAVRDAYNDGDAAWFANTGALVEPVSLKQYKEKTANLPPSVFAHNAMQKSGATLHPQYSAAGGILGRMTKTLMERPSTPYKSDLYSIYGQQKITTGGSNAANVISSRSVLKYAEHHKFAGEIENLTKHESTSYMQDTFKSQLRSILESTETLGANLEATTLDTTFESDRFSQQFKQIAKLIKIHKDANQTNEEKMERAGFVAVSTGWDTHNSFQSVTDRLAEVNAALTSFVAEMKSTNSWNDVVIVTISDFARTLKNNGKGTDHAWGGNYFVMGGDVKGSRIHGHYPTDLFQVPEGVNVGNGRLIPTTAYEHMWKPIAEWFGIGPENIDAVLPNHKNFNDMLSKSDVFE